MNLPACLRSRATFGTLALFSFLAGLVPRAAAEPVPLSSLNIPSWKNGPLSIGGAFYPAGLAGHAPDYIALDLGGGSERLTAQVGVNDSSKGKGSLEFIVRGDKRILWRSGIMRGGEPVKAVDISVKGVRILVLDTTDGDDGHPYDHPALVQATLEVTGVQPKVYSIPASEAVVLTPKPSPRPRINGPSIFGVRPGSPFLYAIPVTGQRPMTYEVQGLPAGLNVNATTGLITGTLDQKATHTVTLRAKNALGEAEKSFRIVVGERIALTPPMGWNSWNCWGGSVSQEKVLGSARALVAKGLTLHGWTYINIDDGWQGARGGSFNAIQPNAKFPDMKALGEELHALGLKLGIYSTPWRGTYEGHIGGSSDNEDGTYEWVKSGDHNVDHRISADPAEWDRKRKNHYFLGKYSFTKNDVQQWAQWGVDYLKYDWRPVDVPNVREMSEALQASGRDIVFSLSSSADFNTGSDLAKLSNAWRTTGDISDTWSSMNGIGFGQNHWAQFHGPGRYNDPDMLVVGWVGWGNPHRTALTPDEQYTHLSLWSLLGGPLLIGADLEKLDEFTLGLLTNDEVLEVNQDALGRQGVRVAKDDQVEVYAKTLEDGSTAVGIFNRGIFPATGTVQWTDLKLPAGSRRVRDLWRQKNIGAFTDAFTAPIAPHGVIFVRIY